MIIKHISNKLSDNVRGENQISRKKSLLWQVIAKKYTFFGNGRTLIKNNDRDIRSYRLIRP